MRSRISARSGAEPSKPGRAEQVHRTINSNGVMYLLIRRSEHVDSAQQTGPQMRYIRTPLAEVGLENISGAWENLP